MPIRGSFLISSGGPLRRSSKLIDSVQSLESESRQLLIGRDIFGGGGVGVGRGGEGLVASRVLIFLLRKAQGAEAQLQLSRQLLIWH